MAFRDDRDAQRHRIDSLEQQLEDAREEAEKLREERDRALEAKEREPERGPQRGAFGRGDAVWVEWRGTWWRGTVRRVEGPIEWLVHYDGWGSQWDEVVGPSRIATRSKAPPGPIGGSPRGLVLALVAVAALGVVGGAVFTFSGSSGSTTASYDTPPGAPVVALGDLQVGQRVLVEWNGRWYPSNVVSVGLASVRIHYDGYSDGSDEDVPRDRVRIP